MSEPDDVPGDCNARCYVGDNHGDTHATFRCTLLPGHWGRHSEEFREGTAKLEWEKDERELPALELSDAAISEIHAISANPPKPTKRMKAAAGRYKAAKKKRL